MAALPERYYFTTLSVTLDYAAVGKRLGFASEAELTAETLWDLAPRIDAQLLTPAAPPRAIFVARDREWDEGATPRRICSPNCRDGLHAHIMFVDTKPFVIVPSKMGMKPKLGEFLWEGLAWSHFWMSDNHWMSKDLYDEPKLEAFATNVLARASEGRRGIPRMMLLRGGSRDFFSEKRICKIETAADAQLGPSGLLRRSRHWEVARTPSCSAVGRAFSLKHLVKREKQLDADTRRSAHLYTADTVALASVWSDISRSLAGQLAAPPASVEPTASPELSPSSSTVVPVVAEASSAILVESSLPPVAVAESSSSCAAVVEASTTDAPEATTTPDATPTSGASPRAPKTQSPSAKNLEKARRMLQGGRAAGDLDAGVASALADFGVPPSGRQADGLDSDEECGDSAETDGGDSETDGVGTRAASILKQPFYVVGMTVSLAFSVVGKTLGFDSEKQLKAAMRRQLNAAKRGVLAQRVHRLLTPDAPPCLVFLARQKMSKRVCTKGCVDGVHAHILFLGAQPWPTRFTREAVKWFCAALGSDVAHSRGAHQARALYRPAVIQDSAWAHAVANDWSKAHDAQWLTGMCAEMLVCANAAADVTRLAPLRVSHGPASAFASQLDAILDVVARKRASGQACVTGESLEQMDDEACAKARSQVDDALAAAAASSGGSYLDSFRKRARDGGVDGDGSDGSDGNDNESGGPPPPKKRAGTSLLGVTAVTTREDAGETTVETCEDEGGTTVATVATREEAGGTTVATGEVTVATREEAGGTTVATGEVTVATREEAGGTTVATVATDATREEAGGTTVATREVTVATREEAGGTAVATREVTAVEQHEDAGKDDGLAKLALYHRDFERYRAALETAEKQADEWRQCAEAWRRFVMEAQQREARSHQEEKEREARAKKEMDDFKAAAEERTRVEVEARVREALERRDAQVQAALEERDAQMQAAVQAATRDAVTDALRRAMERGPRIFK
jgi:hypothetical protein